MSRQVTPRRTLLRTWLRWWVLCAALWMVLDDTTAVPELLDGAAAATIGACASTLVRARSHVGLQPSARWARRWWRPVIGLISDLPQLVSTLVRAVVNGERDPGRVRAVSFAVSRDENMRAAQVALASVVGSVAPATVILAVDEDDQLLVFHELSPREDRVRADPLELG